MAKLWARLGNLLRDPSSWVSGVRPPFGVSCACGQRLTGLRRSRHQVVPCPQCREPVFVLPASPWPSLPPRVVEPADVSTPAASPTLAVKAQPWLGPALAGGIVLALFLVISTVVVLTFLPSLASEHSTAIQQHLDEARQALADGKLASAAGQLNEAGGLIKAGGGRGEQIEEVRTLQRQLAVLTHRLDEALEDLLLRAAHVAAEDWQRTFQERYLGKAVVFETWLLPDADKPERRQTAYQLRAGRERGRLLVEAPRLESHMGRIVLGGLLESVRLESVEGVNEPIWIVRLQPTTVTSITDPGALAWLHRPPSRRPPVKPAEVRDLSHLENRPGNLAPGAFESQIKEKLGEPIVLGRQLLTAHLIEQWCYPGEHQSLLLLAGNPRAELQLWQPGTPVPNAH